MRYFGRGIAQTGHFAIGDSPRFKIGHLRRTCRARERRPLLSPLESAVMRAVAGARGRGPSVHRSCLPDAPVGYASGVKDFQPFLCVALVLSALRVSLVIDPVSAAAPILTAPDRRASPHRVTPRKDIHRYRDGGGGRPATSPTRK